MSKWLQAAVCSLGEFQIELIGQISFIAMIRGGKVSYKQTLAIRIDIDALLIQKEIGLSYASVQVEVMHAGDHDTKFC